MHGGSQLSRSNRGGCNRRLNGKHSYQAASSACWGSAVGAGGYSAGLHGGGPVGKRGGEQGRLHACARVLDLVTGVPKTSPPAFRLRLLEGGLRSRSRRRCCCSERSAAARRAAMFEGRPRGGLLSRSNTLPSNPGGQPSAFMVFDTPIPIFVAGVLAAPGLSPPFSAGVHGLRGAAIRATQLLANSSVVAPNKAYLVRQRLFVHCARNTLRAEHTARSWVLHCRAWGLVGGTEAPARFPAKQPTHLPNGQNAFSEVSRRSEDRLPCRARGQGQGQGHRL